MKAKITLVQGDLTRERVEAIVNAANSSLLGGGGVDGAIHRAAGPELLEECRQLQGCPTGEARLTRGYRLPARWVIHTVGPVWHGGSHHEDERLASCYRQSLALATTQQVKTIAFPAISTGAYGFPLERATRIALAETIAFLEQPSSVEEVRFVCFDAPTLAVYRSVLQDLQAA
jgi:O-acetyl-ADP-ribose deacetylase